MKTLTRRQEEKLRRGLGVMVDETPPGHDVSELDQLWATPISPQRRTGAWVGVGAFVAVVALFSPLFLFSGADPDGESVGPAGAPLATAEATPPTPPTSDGPSPGEDSGVSDGGDTADEGPTRNATGRELITRNGLTLTIRGPADRPCVEVRSEEAMAGGCGAALNQTLHLGTGTIDGVSFVNGWAPANAASVVLSLADGTQVEITELVGVDNLGVRFYLELLRSTDGGEPELPITATALDSNGQVITRFELSDQAMTATSAPES